MRLVVSFLFIFSFVGTAKENTKIRVVSEMMPPYQFYDGERVVGTNVELLNGVFSKANIPFPDVELYPWTRAYNLALKHENTFIFPIVRTPEREHLFEWVAPMATATYSLFGLKLRDDILLENVNDVATLRIAVTKDDITHKYFKKLGFEEGEHFLITSDWLLIEKLFFNQKLDLIVSTSAHFELQSNRNNVNVNDYEEKFQLNDLQLRYYLATNRQSNSDIVERLRRVFPKQPAQY